jgi:hypothetical protein
MLIHDRASQLGKFPGRLRLARHPAKISEHNTDHDSNRVGNFSRLTHQGSPVKTASVAPWPL